AQDVPFSNKVDDSQPPFTLRRFLAPKRAAIAVVMMMVALEVVAQQLGPRLAQMAIDKGVIPRDFSVVLTLALVYLAAVIIGACITALRTMWSGRIGEDLLYGLRVR